MQPEDAGVYQVRVEDIPIFSTELDAQGKEFSLRDVMCNCNKILSRKIVSRSKCEAQQLLTTTKDWFCVAQ